MRLAVPDSSPGYGRRVAPLYRSGRGFCGIPAGISPNLELREVGRNPIDTQGSPEVHEPVGIPTYSLACPGTGLEFGKPTIQLKRGWASNHKLRDKEVT